MQLRLFILFYSRLCPSTSGSSPPPEFSNFLCHLLSLSISFPVAPQCHLFNDIFVNIDYNLGYRNNTLTHILHDCFHTQPGGGGGGGEDHTQPQGAVIVVFRLLQSYIPRTQPQGAVIVVFRLLQSYIPRTQPQGAVIVVFRLLQSYIPPHRATGSCYCCFSVAPELHTPTPSHRELLLLLLGGSKATCQVHIGDNIVYRNFDLLPPFHPWTAFAFQTCYLTQSQYTDTGPTCPNPIRTG